MEHEGGHFRRDRAYFGVLLPATGCASLKASRLRDSAPNSRQFARSSTDELRAFVGPRIETSSTIREWQQPNVRFIGARGGDRSRRRFSFGAGLCPRGGGALRSTLGEAHREGGLRSSMRYPQGMENGARARLQKLDRAHTVRGDRLVETTPEVNREVAESAMLLAQGARRAIEMMRDAENGDAKPPAPAAATRAEAHTT